MNCFCITGWLQNATMYVWQLNDFLGMPITFISLLFVNIAFLCVHSVHEFYNENKIESITRVIIIILEMKPCIFELSSRSSQLIIIISSWVLEPNLRVKSVRFFSTLTRTSSLWARMPQILFRIYELLIFFFIISLFAIVWTLCLHTFVSRGVIRIQVGFRGYWSRSK